MYKFLVKASPEHMVCYLEVHVYVLVFFPSQSLPQLGLNLRLHCEQTNNLREHVSGGVRLEQSLPSIRCMLSPPQVLLIEFLPRVPLFRPD